MPIFRIENQKLRKFHIAPLGKERELQRLLEANLPEALGLRFLASEYTTTTGGRIDTLAVDEAGCPVIIEYKRNRSDSVIKQALLKGAPPGSWLAQMLARKPRMLVAVALANKTARIVWALLATGGTYRAPAPAG